MSVSLNHLRILLIDDHYFMRSIWRSILLGLGVNTVVEAQDATEAFEILPHEEIDLAIVDFHLGDLNGSEIIRMLRTSPDSPDRYLPIIGCTADTRPSVIQDFINAGSDELLAKPISCAGTWQRLYAVTENRRSFVRTPTFFGPDRRRRDNPNYRGPERRSNTFNLE